MALTLREMMLTGTPLLAVLQDATQAAVDLGRIANAQIVMAAATVVLALIAVGLIGAALWTMRSANRLLRSAEAVVKGIVPKLEPLVQEATEVARDLRSLTANLREEAPELRATVNRLNVDFRAAVEEAERRVKQFGAVLDVVQEESVDLAIGAIAAARGVQATAHALGRFEDSLPPARRVAGSENAPSLPHPEE